MTRRVDCPTGMKTKSKTSSEAREVQRQVQELSAGRAGAEAGTPPVEA